MTLQIVAKLTNQKSLCIGEISTKEAVSSMDSDIHVDGFGVYLLTVDNNKPSEPGTILAKFVSEHAAQVVARFLRAHGHLEIA